MWCRPNINLNEVINQKKYINADLNGSLNILRKAVPNVKFTNGIEVGGSPDIINIKESKFLYF